MQTSAHNTNGVSETFPELGQWEGWDNAVAFDDDDSHAFGKRYDKLSNNGVQAYLHFWWLLTFIGKGASK